MTTNNLTAITYARVSSQKQQDNWSIVAQQRAVMKKATESNMCVVAQYIDVRSGKSMERPGLQQALAFLASHRVTALIVWRLNRLSRNLSDLLTVFEICAEHGVSIISVTEPGIGTGSTAKLNVSLLGIVGQLERTLLVENQKLAYGEKQRQGQLISSSLPLGYVWDKVTKQALIDPVSALVVKAVFTAYLQGKGYRSISKMIHLLYKKTVSPAGVRLILRNQRYTGDVLNAYGSKPDMLPAIIDKDTFQRVQLETMKRRKPRQSRPLWLKQRLVCPVCQNHWLSTAQTKSHYYYECGQVGAGRWRISADDIEQQVLQLLNSHIDVDSASSGLDVAEQQSDNAARELERLLLAYERGAVSLAGFQTAKAALQEKQQVRKSSVALDIRSKITGILAGPSTYDNLEALHPYIQSVRIDAEKRTVSTIVLNDGSTIDS
ncbi:recombinase family protein [Lacticaseibacillus saniviri]